MDSSNKKLQKKRLIEFGKSKNDNKNKDVLAEVCDEMFEKLNDRSINDLISNSGSGTFREGIIQLKFFNDEILVEPENKKIYFKDGRDRNIDYFAIPIILSYLLTSDGAPMDRKWISYRELPGGLFYGETIPKVLEPLAKKYETGGEEFVKKAKSIGGIENPSFENSSVLYAFRCLPVLLVLDEKDEEFEGNVRILFDSSVPHYLKTDVIKSLIIYIVKKMLN